MKWTLLLLILAGCSNNCLEDYQEDANSVMASITKELQEVHSRRELLGHQKRLKRLFTQLATLSIEAREFMDKHPESRASISEEAQAIKAELQRLYQIDGCREVLEGAQADGLDLLDECEAALKKERKWSRRP